MLRHRRRARAWTPGLCRTAANATTATRIKSRCNAARGIADVVHCVSSGDVRGVRCVCGGFSAARDIADIVHCVSRGTFGDDTEAYAACAGDLVQSEASQMSRTACLAGMFDDGTEPCATCTTGYVQPAVSQTSGTACLAHGVHCVSSGDVRRRHRGGAAGTEGSGSPKHCRRCALRVWRMFDDDTEVCAAGTTGSVRPAVSQTSCTACLAGTLDDGTEMCAAGAGGSVQPEVSRMSGRGVLGSVFCGPRW